MRNSICADVTEIITQPCFEYNYFSKTFEIRICGSFSKRCIRHNNTEAKIFIILVLRLNAIDPCQLLIQRKLILQMQSNSDQLHVEADSATAFIFHATVNVCAENYSENISIVAEGCILRSEKIYKNSMMRICKTPADARIRDQRVGG